MPKRTSRLESLAQREEKSTVKRIVFLSFLSLILAVFLFTLGLPLLVKFADLLEVIFKRNELVVSDKSIIRPPRLDPLPTATNSAKLTVSGFSDDESTVEIYLNSEKVGEAKTLSQKFKYEDITLKNGQNEIFAKAKNSTDKTSDSSQTTTITLDLEEPKLEIETPQENQSFSGDNRIKVKGTTDKDAQVLANGFLAVVNTDGIFEVVIPLTEGENQLEIKAVDTAGNAKTTTRKVNFRK